MDTASHIISALVIMLVSFAYLEEDRVLLCISLAAALASFAITAATVWATVRATESTGEIVAENVDSPGRERPVNPTAPANPTAL